MADLLIRPGVVIPEREIQLQLARSGGPGGQHVNKVSTKVELRFAPGTSSALTPEDRALILARLGNRLTKEGELVVVSDRTRHQARNREDAMDKLAELLRGALVRTKRRRATRPSRGSVRRRLSDKRHRSGVKQGRRDPGDD